MENRKKIKNKSGKLIEVAHRVIPLNNLIITHFPTDGHLFRCSSSATGTGFSPVPDQFRLLTMDIIRQKEGEINEY
ncbi:hypothetical protein ACH0BF_20245 [Pseudobacillus sp. 179-B 2D1 NHS]|uniref:hypothetical protein n=1 Tax=Pseudobacillus sp. 179-B 2D1 NHS TaxID=3374292 RepID=UPI00387A2A3B